MVFLKFVNRAMNNVLKNPCSIHFFLCYPQQVGFILVSRNRHRKTKSLSSATYFLLHECHLELRLPFHNPKEIQFEEKPTC